MEQSITAQEINITSKIEIIYNNNKILIDFVINYTGMCTGAIITIGLIRMMFN